MSKRKAEGALEQGTHCEGDTTEVVLAEATSARQTTNIRADTPAEGGTREAPATPAVAPASHVDCEGAGLFWMLLEAAGYTIW